MNKLIKYSLYTVGGVTLATMATAGGGIGIVGGGLAWGLSLAEVATIGGAAGATVCKLKEDQAEAKRATKLAKDKIAKARQVLDDLEADEPAKPSVFVAVDSSTDYV